MPTLDPNSAPKDFELSMLAQVNAAIDRLRGTLVPKLELSNPEKAVAKAALVRCYTQVMVRRSLDLLDAALSEQRNGREVAVQLCNRAILETVAVFVSFEQKFDSMITNGDAQAITAFLNDQLTLTKIPMHVNAGKTNEAKSIMHYLRILNKRHSFILPLYENMSDAAHPSLVGTTAMFLHLDDNNTAIFGVNKATRSSTKGFLYGAAALLFYLEESILNVEANIPRMNAL